MADNFLSQIARGFWVMNKKVRKVAEGLFNLVVFTTKIAWHIGVGLANLIKTVVIAIAKIKRDVSDKIVNGYNEPHKQKLEDEFDEKLKKYKK